MRKNSRRNKQSRHRISGLSSRVFILALLLCSTASTRAQDNPALQVEDSDLERSLDFIEVIAQLQSRIENIQSESGTYNPALLQPLDDLAQIYVEAQNYESAVQLLDHQLQIHRINSGLYAAQQIPLVEAMLQMQAQMNDWVKVNDSLSNLSWLYQRTTTLDAETQLQGLQMLGSWQLRALEKDTPERQAQHLVELTKIDERTAEIAQRHFGDDSPALSPYLYNQALADTYVALAISLTDATSRDLMLLTEGIRDRSSIPLNTNVLRTNADIEAMYGSKVSSVIERSFRKNMDDSIAKIERIVELYVKSGNIEAEGLTLMYLGDAHLIRQQFENRPSNFAGINRGSSNIGIAMSHYDDALARLSEAGISADTLAEFTRCPVMLPVQTLHETVQAALTVCERSTETGLINLGEYNFVSTLIPGLEGSVDGAEGVISARVKFKVRGNGQVSHDNIEEIEPDDITSRVQIRKLLDIMQFRPAIIDGDAVRSEDLQLVIRIPKTN